MRRSWVVLLVACAAVAAVGVVVVLVTGRASVVHSRPGAAAASVRRSSVSAAADAGQVASALKRLPGDPAALVATGAQAQVAGRAQEAFPPGTSVQPDARSWAPDGVGGGTMLVTVSVPAHAPVAYDAIMVREDGQWKVLATVRMPSVPSGQASASASAS